MIGYNPYQVNKSFDDAIVISTLWRHRNFDVSRQLKMVDFWAITEYLQNRWTDFHRTYGIFVNFCY